MRQDDLSQNEIVAWCDDCDRETVHGVTLALESTTDGTKVTSQNLKFAKSPGRTVPTRLRQFTTDGNYS